MFGEDTLNHNLKPSMLKEYTLNNNQTPYMEKDCCLIKGFWKPGCTGHDCSTAADAVADRRLALATGNDFRHVSCCICCCEAQFWVKQRHAGFTISRIISGLEILLKFIPVQKMVLPSIILMAAHASKPLCIKCHDSDCCGST